MIDLQIDKKYNNGRHVSFDDNRVLKFNDEISIIRDEKTPSFMDNLKKIHIFSKKIKKHNISNENLAFILRNYMFSTFYKKEFLIDANLNIEEYFLKKKNKEEVIKICISKEEYSFTSVDGKRIFNSAIKRTKFGSWKYVSYVTTKETLGYLTLNSTLEKMNLKKQISGQVRIIVLEINSITKKLKKIGREELLKLDFNNIKNGK